MARKTTSRSRTPAGDGGDDETTRAGRATGADAAASDTGYADTAGDEAAAEQRSSPEVRTGLIDGDSFAALPVQYAVVDGMAVFEGDIILGTVEEVEERTSRARQGSVAGGQVARGVAITGNQFRWPNARVPYEISSGLGNQARVTDAIKHWQDNTAIRFILRTAANASQFPDFVRFVSGGECSSSVGRRGGRQDIVLGPDCSTGNAIHEIGHTIGLWHEQSRQDRDSFVTILWANIKAGLEFNFNQHISDGDDIGAYDYGSVMHYPRRAFSKNPSTLDTIVPVQPGAVIGQRSGLSAGDLAAVRQLYPQGSISVKKTRDDQVVTKKAIDDPIPSLKKTRDDQIVSKKSIDDPIPSLKKTRDDQIVSKKSIDDPIPSLKKTRDDASFQKKARDDIAGGGRPRPFPFGRGAGGGTSAPSSSRPRTTRRV